MNNTTEPTGAPLSYWNYAKLDDLLSLQAPLTNAHDEMQFIMVHQVFELWFRLAIYELRGAIARLESGDLAGGGQLLKRVASILRSSVHGFDPLMTMSPEGYAEFRDALHPASGFQSAQFRVLEIMLGIERVEREEGNEKHERFYWENAVQAGVTFDHFVEKYYTELAQAYDDMKERNIRRLTLRLVEEATGKNRADAYRAVLADPAAYPELHALTLTARDLQQAVHDFRKGHHKVTRFTIGEHAAGTSDSHAASHPSCAAYLSNVMKEHKVIFEELDAAFNEL